MEITNKEHLDILKRIYIQALDKANTPYTGLDEKHFKAIADDLETFNKIIDHMKQGRIITARDGKIYSLELPPVVFRNCKTIKIDRKKSNK